MTYKFTDIEIAVIQGRFDVASSTPGRWDDAYRYVANLLEKKVLPDGSHPIDDPETRKSWLFISGAAMVNEDVGPFSTLIRGFALRQAELRGITPNGDLQQVSDNVARDFFRQILDPTNDAYSGGCQREPES